MQRFIIGVVTVIVLGACGSGDDAGDDVADDVTQEETADGTAEPADEPTEEPTDEPAADDQGDDGGQDAQDDDGQDDGVDDDGRVVVDGLSDMPSECIDLFRDFLREIEPIVSPIDWQQATLDQFGTLGQEFETISEDFDTESERLGCNRFDLASDDAAFEEMVEFARSEAPGTVGFFEFIEQLQAAIPDDPTGGGDDGAAPDGAAETCDEAFAVIEDLADEYGQLTQVPASEFLEVSQLLTGITNLCTPTELNEFFQREDIAAFLGG